MGNSKKYNFGIDAQLWDNKIELTTDFFKDIRTGIFQERAAIPDESGWVTLPFSNVGSMRSSGIDGNVSFNQSLVKIYI